MTPGTSRHKHIAVTNMFAALSSQKPVTASKALLICKALHYVLLSKYRDMSFSLRPEILCQELEVRKFGAVESKL